MHSGQFCEDLNINIYISRITGETVSEPRLKLILSRLK